MQLGIRIRATDKLQFKEVVSRHHSGVGRVELIGETFFFQLIPNLVHPLSDDQGRTLGPLGEKVTHGASN